VLTAAVLLLGGCSGRTSEHADAAPTATAGAAARYGFGPSPHGDVEYQPDVVIVGGGPSAIRSASSDGLTWYVARSAPGADRLAPGKVMYATGLAVGRVARVVPDGDQLAVTVVPVGIGEVIRNGHLHASQDLDLAGWGLQDVPDLPGRTGAVAATPSPSRGAGRAATGTTSRRASRNATRTASRGASRGTARRHLAAAPVALKLGPSLPPPFTQGSAPWHAEEWSGTVTRSSGDVWLHVEHAGEGLKAYIDMRFHFVKPHLDADVGIVDGEVGDSELQLRGLRQVVLQIKAGSVNGLSDNLSQKVEIPVSLNAPVIVGGVAMNLNVHFRFLAETAFTARNSTLQAVGDWQTDGPLFYRRSSGKLTVGMPKVTSQHKFIDSLTGISLGVNGFVFTTEIRVSLGLGTPTANAGPYARLVTSVGLTVGSSVGLIRCRQVTVTVTGAAGVGLLLSDNVAKGINVLLAALGLANRVAEENTKDVVSRQLYNTAFWSPDLPVCRLGG
jgi:hypothetical protein